MNKDLFMCSARQPNWKKR